MNELPRVRRLLQQLLELTDEDAQLPLDILINLHRNQLREPLQRFANWTVWTQQHDEAAKRLIVLLDAEYPILAAGNVFQASKALMMELERQEQAQNELHMGHLRKLSETVDASMQVKSIVDVLLKYAGMDWVAYDPLVRLHALSLVLPGIPRSTQLNMLEIELGVEPTVSRMILEVAERNIG